MIRIKQGLKDRREALGNRFSCRFHVYKSVDKCFYSKKRKRHAGIMINENVCGRNGLEVIRKSIFKTHILGSRQHWVNANTSF